MPHVARRTVLAGAASLALRPARAAGRSLDLVLESEAVILDPYATTAAITALFGLLAGMTSPRTAIVVAGLLLLATPLVLPRGDQLFILR